MKRITIFLRSGEHINLPADEMDCRDEVLRAWRGDDLVVYADTSAVICAYLSLRYDRQEDLLIQVKTFCCDKYKNCEVYQMLKQIYEGDDNG